MSRFFLQNMEGYTADEESQGERSHDSQSMQELGAPIFKSNQILVF